MTDDLSALLSAQIRRFESARIRDEDLPLSSSMSCVIEATVSEPDPGTDGPTVTARADILPGGMISEVQLEARHGAESRTMDVDEDTGLHRSLQSWCDDMWSSWDEVPVGTPGEAMDVRVGELQPGDYLWRYGVTVAGMQLTAMNSAEEMVVTVTFEETKGTEVWTTDKLLTVIRVVDDTSDDPHG